MEVSSSTVTCFRYDSETKEKSGSGPVLVQSLWSGELAFDLSGGGVSLDGINQLDTRDKNSLLDRTSVHTMQDQRQGQYLHG
jgi:hypothetical protein